VCIDKKITRVKEYIPLPDYFGARAHIKSFFYGCDLYYFFAFKILLAFLLGDIALLINTMIVNPSNSLCRVSCTCCVELWRAWH
jgi:hypothetical protein